MGAIITRDWFIPTVGVVSLKIWPRLFLIHLVHSTGQRQRIACEFPIAEVRFRETTGGGVYSGESAFGPRRRAQSLRLAAAARPAPARV
jgi:hypothetical protein